MCILLVDDEALIRLLLSDELMHEGWEVVGAASGDAAVSMIDEPLCRFTMVITDIQMPGLLDGLGVARRTRERFPHVPIILTTGRPEVLRSFGPRRDNEAVLIKPFLARELVTQVRRLFALDARSGTRVLA